MNCLLCNGDSQNLGNYPCIKDWTTDVFFCQECGSIFRYPMPNIDMLLEYYNNIPFKGSKRTLKRRLRKCRLQAVALKKTMQKLEFSTNGVVLDIGAGIGGLVCALREKGFENVLGMEPRQSAREFAINELNIDLKDGWLFDAHKFKKRSNQASLLILSHVMEHLSDPCSALAYLKQYYSGSLLWIEVPDGESEARMHGNHVAWSLWLEQHLFSYTKKGLSALLTANGMEVLDIERGAIYKNLQQMREREFRISKLCAEASSRVGIGPRMIAKLMPELALYFTSLVYLNTIRKIPCLEIPDSPFYLRVTARI